MVAVKHTSLPDYRAYDLAYRTDYRAGRSIRKTDYRSYYERNRQFLGPIIGHLLDKPSVGLNLCLEIRAVRLARPKSFQARRLDA